MKIAPSLLAADFTSLHTEIEKVQNSDMLHLDIMDGHFVPNISFGYDIVKSIRPLTPVLFDVHLMLSHPLKYIENFANAGADYISFHVECEDDTLEVINKIKSCGVKAALAVKPGTAIDEIFKYCDQIDMVVIMTVEPGFGGQKMMIEQLEKAKIIKSKYPNILVQADGGIGRDNIAVCAEKSVDVCVCGTSVFKSENPGLEIANFQKVSK